MTDPLEPLSPEVASLLERERNAYAEDPAQKRAVLAGVERTIGLVGPVPGGGGGAPLAPVRKAAPLGKLMTVGVSAFVAGVLVGGTAVKTALHDHASAVAAAPSSQSGAATLSRGATPEGTPAVPGAAPTSAAAPVPPAPEVPAATRTSASAASVALATSARGDLTRERELLDVARAALSRDRADDAIATAEQHAKKWPNGYLSEEREVVWIRALLAAGKRESAEQHALHFRRSFPKSMLTPAVDAALAPSVAVPYEPPRAAPP